MAYQEFYQSYKEVDIIKVVKSGRFEPLQETDLYKTRRYREERKTFSEMIWEHRRRYSDPGRQWLKDQWRIIFRKYSQI
jgi:hypothetical protein